MQFRHRWALVPLVFSALVTGIPTAGWAGSGEYVDGELVLLLASGSSIDDVTARWDLTLLESFPVGDVHLCRYDGPTDLELLAETITISDTDVVEAEANYRQDTPEGVRDMVIVAVGGDFGDYEDQQLTERIQLDAAHGVSRGGGVTIGLLDTGVDPTHEALVGHLAPGGWDFVDNDDAPWDVADGFDGDDDGSIDEGWGHGTMVAGVLALTAPDAKILPIRVLDDEGRGDAFRIALAIRYAVEQGADVLNLSLGVPTQTYTIRREVRAAYALGIPTVAAAGNENTDNAPYFPAADSKAMMITAVDSVDVKASFADWGSDVHICAPGTGVRSAFPGGEWAIGSGCSFATPFVAGSVALMLSLNPSIPSKALETLVRAGVDPIDHLPGNEPYEGDLGGGRLHVLDAVNSVLPVSVPASTTPATPQLAAWPQPARTGVEIGFHDRSLMIEATVEIFSVTGRRVASLSLENGRAFWALEDGTGERVSPGIYFLKGAGAIPVAAARIVVAR